MSKKLLLSALLAGGLAAAVLTNDGDDSQEQAQVPYQDQPSPPYQGYPPGGEYYPDHERDFEDENEEETEYYEGQVEADRLGPSMVQEVEARIKGNANTFLQPGFQIQFPDQPKVPQNPVWKSSQLFQALMVYKDHRAFKMLAPTAEAARRHRAPDRRTILLDSWESYRYFGQMLTNIIVASLSPRAARDLATERFINWFNYHDWQLDPSGEVWRDMRNKLTGYSGRSDVRVWPEGEEGEKNGVAVPFGDLTASELNDLRRLPRIHTSRVAKVVNYDGLTLLLEYATARFLSLSMAQAILQQQGFQANVAGMIESGLTETLVAGIRLGSAARGATSQGVESMAGLGAVGVIVTAAMAAAAALAKVATGIGHEVAFWDSMPLLRAGISKRIQNTLRTHFRGRTIQDFSGYKLGCIRLSQKPIDDVKDPLWQYFFFSTRGRINVGPQLPCYYLGLDFDLTWSIACADHSLVLLHPRLNAQRLPFAFSTYLLPQAVLSSSPESLEMDVQHDPSDGIPTQYRPPACWPRGPEKGWKG